MDLTLFWRSFRARCFVLVGAMACSFGAGAVSIRQVVNSNPTLCHQFVDILKAADVPHMTDTQLCKFRFDQLPVSLTKDFTFPHWKELKVSDPLQMYKRMVLANWRGNWAKSATAKQFFGNYIQALYQGYQVVEQAANKQAVKFYTTMLPAPQWSGDSGQPEAIKRLPKNFYLVQMRINFCRDRQLRFGDYYAVSRHADLKESFDADALGATSIALWNGHLLLIDVGPTLWLDRPKASLPSINPTINLGAWYPSGYSNVYQQPFRAGFSPGPTICSYSVQK